MLIHSCIFDSLNTIHVNVIPYNRTVLSLLYRHDTHQFLFLILYCSIRQRTSTRKYVMDPLKLLRGSENTVQKTKKDEFHLIYIL